MANAPVILFVHGTWSSPKIWDKFEIYLEEHLRVNGSIKFDRVPWSGGNSAFARREGVRKFEELASKYSEHPIYVISHSHGANVALEARQDIRDRIRCLICLNSPIITTIKGSLPWPMTVSFVVLLLLALVAGIAFVYGLALHSFITAVLTILLVGGMFYAANSAYAFLLFPLIAVAAGYSLKGLIGGWRYAAEIQEAWLSITAAVLLLGPVLTVYAFWARRYATSVNPNAVKRLIQIVTVDDEVFTLLGLGLFAQRATQFLLWPFKKVFALTTVLTLAAMGLAVVSVVGKIWPAFNRFEELYVSIIAIPCGVFPAIGAILIFARLFLLGIGYGWDMAGLSINHAIYVSPGSFNQPTEVHTLLPEGDKEIWVSHTAIHDRESAQKMVCEMLKPEIFGYHNKLARVGKQSL